MDTNNLGAGSGIYLDNNATTMIDPKVVEAMMPYFTTYYGNASSQHGFGVPVEKAIARAREQVADLIGAQYPDEIIFTSCATESDNTALWTSLWTQKNKDEIVTSRLEHPAIIDTCSFLEARNVKIKYLHADSKGDLNADEFKSLLSDRTALASIMWANNETGNIYDVPGLSEIAAEKGVLFHSDAVQAVGKIPVDVKSTQVRMLSFSGHKLHAPKGIGVLYVRRGTRFLPYLHGGLRPRVAGILPAVVVGRYDELDAGIIFKKALRNGEKIPRVDADDSHAPRSLVDGNAGSPALADEYRPLFAGRDDARPAPGRVGIIRKNAEKSLLPSSSAVVLLVHVYKLARPYLAVNISKCDDEVVTPQPRAGDGMQLLLHGVTMSGVRLRRVGPLHADLALIALLFNLFLTLAFKPLLLLALEILALLLLGK